MGGKVEIVMYPSDELSPENLAEIEVTIRGELAKLNRRSFEIEMEISEQNEIIDEAKQELYYLAKEQAENNQYILDAKAKLNNLLPLWEK